MHFKTLSINFRRECQILRIQRQHQKIMDFGDGEPRNQQVSLANKGKEMKSKN